VIPVAHAGHVLIDALYLLPLAVLVGLVAAGKLRERREARRRARGA
jgi:hypothetical protein